MTQNAVGPPGMAASQGISPQTPGLLAGITAGGSGARIAGRGLAEDQRPNPGALGRSCKA